MKWCNGCKRMLEMSMFNLSRSEKDGHAHRCKECRKMDYWERGGREYQKKYMEKYYPTHIPDFRKRSYKWMEENYKEWRDYEKGYLKEYYIKNREKLLEYASQKRIRKNK